MFQHVGVLIPTGLLCTQACEQLVYFYSIPNCTKFDMNQIIRDVTIVSVKGGVRCFRSTELYTDLDLRSIRIYVRFYNA